MRKAEASHGHSGTAEMWRLLYHQHKRKGFLSYPNPAYIQVKEEDQLQKSTAKWSRRRSLFKKIKEKKKTIMIWPLLLCTSWDGFFPTSTEGYSFAAKHFLLNAQDPLKCSQLPPPAPPALSFPCGLSFQQINAKGGEVAPAASEGHRNEGVCAGPWDSLLGASSIS